MSSGYQRRTEMLPAETAGIHRAVEVLKAGGLVAFPTDTVYGVAAWPWDDEAVRRLYEAKRRPADMPIPLLLSDAGQVERVAVLPERCRPLLNRFWPGGLTLVLTKKASVSDVISPRTTVAVRMPDLALALDLIGEAGGVLAVTSANMSGQPSPVTAQEVKEQMEGRIDLILDGGPCPGGVPSTIIDCSISLPRILRHGAIDEAVLNSSGLLPDRE